MQALVPQAGDVVVGGGIPLMQRDLSAEKEIDFNGKALI